MTRKSARYIGGQCYEHAKELEQKTKWLTKKINRKLLQEHRIRIHDSYYDMEGVYLIFKKYNIIHIPYHPPETIVVDMSRVWSAVSEAAMVDMHKLTVAANCTWKDNPCFMIHIPFKVYFRRTRLSDYMEREE